MQNSDFELVISTPNKICVNEKVKEISFFTNTGYITILPNHQDIVGLLSPNFIFICNIHGTKQKAIANYGTFSLKNNKLTILTDFFAFTNDKIDMDQIISNQKKINEELEQFFIHNAKSKRFLKLFTYSLIKKLKTGN